MMRWIRSAGAGVAMIGAAGCGSPPEPAADVLLVGGSVYTLDWPEPDAGDGRPSPASSWTEAHGWRPSAGAVAVADGRIVWVGSATDAAVWRSRAGRVVELAGAAVLPGRLDGVIAEADGQVVLGPADDAADWRSLRRAGRTVAFGAGAGVERLRGALGIAASAGDSVTVEEAVRAVSGGATLAVGEAADLIVVAPDPFRTPRADWLRTGRATLRMVEGRLVREGGGG